MSLYVAVNTTERRAVRRRYAPKESLHALWLKIYELERFRPNMGQAS